jgi:hypothetical protein
MTMKAQLVALALVPAASAARTTSRALPLATLADLVGAAMSLAAAWGDDGD